MDSFPWPLPCFLAGPRDARRGRWLGSWLPLAGFSFPCNQSADCKLCARAGSAAGRGHIEASCGLRQSERGAGLTPFRIDQILPDLITR